MRPMAERSALPHRGDSVKEKRQIRPFGFASFLLPFKKMVFFSCILTRPIGYDKILIQTHIILTERSEQIHEKQLT